MKDALITIIAMFIICSLLIIIINSGNMSQREIEVAKYKCFDVALDFNLSPRGRRVDQSLICICTDKYQLVNLKPNKYKKKLQ